METCKICGKKFNTKKGLEAHMRIVHGVTAKKAAEKKATKKVKKSVSKAKKKAPAKKKVVAKRSSKKVNKKDFNRVRVFIVETDKPFYVKDGTVLRSIADLIKSLDYMNDEIFYQHVNNERNDFYNWIADVFDKEIAETIKKVDSKLEMQVNLLEELLNRYEAYVGEFEE